jgi:hypothetical protein
VGANDIVGLQREKKRRKTVPARPIRILPDATAYADMPAVRFDNSLAHHRPNPVPMVHLVEKKGSKIRVRVAAFIPQPVSKIVTYTPSAPVRAYGRMVIHSST